MLPLLGSPYNIGQGFTVNADGSVVLTKQIPPTANYGLLSIGAGPWDGASAGHYVGNGNGTVISTNVSSGYSGDLMSLQVSGSNKFSVTSGGNVHLAGMVQAITNGLSTKQKAGVPVDTDWSPPPPDGTMVIDSTNSKLWARVGGVWKGVALA